MQLCKKIRVVIFKIKGWKNGKPKKEKKYRKKERKDRNLKKKIDSIDAIPRAKSVRCWTKKSKWK